MLVDVVSARRHDEINELLAQLPDKSLKRVKRFIEDEMRALQDPVFRSMIEAPIDDEPETASERRAVQQGRKDVAEGRVLSLDDLKRELSSRAKPRPKKPVRRQRAK